MREVIGDGFDAGQQDDSLRDVRHLLDRLYTVEGGSESEYLELIRQILLAGVDATPLDPSI